MRTIHCIAYDPANKHAESTDTTVNWRVRYDAAQELYMQALQDPALQDKRVTYFELRVPEHYSNDDVTAMAHMAAYGEFYRPIQRREPVPEAA